MKFSRCSLHGKWKRLRLPWFELYIVFGVIVVKFQMITVHIALVALGIVTN
jgi:hypothetical protein